MTNETRDKLIELLNKDSERLLHERQITFWQEGDKIAELTGHMDACEIIIQSLLHRIIGKVSTNELLSYAHGVFVGMMDIIHHIQMLEEMATLSGSGTQSEGYNPFIRSNIIKDRLSTPIGKSQEIDRMINAVLPVVSVDLLVNDYFPAFKNKPEYEDARLELLEGAFKELYKRYTRWMKVTKSLTFNHSFKMAKDELPTTNEDMLILIKPRTATFIECEGMSNPKDIFITGNYDMATEKWYTHDSRAEVKNWDNSVSNEWEVVAWIPLDYGYKRVKDE